MFPTRSAGGEARIASVTVAFNPDPVRLATQATALTKQVDEVLIVDNGSSPSVATILARPEIAAQFGAGGAIRVLEIAQNKGIAHAFNHGVDAANKAGARFVVLLDDDSIPAADMVCRLLAAHEQAAADHPGDVVAAVGPRIVDPRDAYEYPFIRLGWLYNAHLRHTDGGANLIACDFLISSGSLFAVRALDAIGGFEDALFIDNVDFEWCCRARAGGFLLFGVCDATLDHRLGDERRLIFNRYSLVVHSPSRIYYQTRNRLLLYRRGYVPLKWKLKDMLRMTARFVAIMLFVAPRMEYLRMTLLGTLDGISNRGGQLKERG